MRFSRHLSIYLALLLGVPRTFVAAGTTTQKVYRVMAVGDSITAGGTTFSNWRFALWEKLYTAGYLIAYVGSQKGESRIGTLLHEGYPGKNAEFIAPAAAKSFRDHPADIVLIHAGHNHSVEEQPVQAIVSATESMIRSFRRTNPRVIILLAQVIHSGELPKYAYIPALNDALAQLAQRLDTPQQRVVLVDQAKDFDPATDTVADRVHPNAAGAEKMASCWFAALQQVLEKPTCSYEPRLVTYKKTDGRDLKLHIFDSAGPNAAKPRPAIVFFFGGAWKAGTPLQFYPECAHFAAMGMVAISADYRIESKDHSTPFDSVTDGKSAIRWIRQHARQLGVDPNRIVAAGASAGGQVAAAAGTLPGLDDPAEDSAISSKPSAEILWYPVIDNGPDGYGDVRVKARYREFSPLHNITSTTPPTLIFLGTQDSCIPVKTIKEYQSRMAGAGVRCDLKLFEGRGHPIYEYRKGDSPYRQQILADSDAFLVSLGWPITPEASTNSSARGRDDVH